MSTWPPSRWSSTWSSWLPDEEGDEDDEDKNVDGGDDDCWHNLSFLQRDRCEMKLYWLLKRLFQLNSTGGKERGGQRREKRKKVSSAQFFARYSAFLILCQAFTTIPYIVFMMKALLIQMEGGMFSLPKLKLSLEFKPSLGVTPISHWIYNCKGKLYILH